MNLFGKNQYWCKEKIRKEIDETIHNFAIKMDEITEELSLSNHKLRPKQIWNVASASMNKK